MKKNKKHKWKYQINIKKKVIVSIILGVCLFVGLGYAVLESNLSIGGTLEVGKYDKTLYGVMKSNVNNGYILKYTGAHQDSMDPTKSTEDIYYFAADTVAKGNEIRNMNNVVFADKCWQIIRTTDTGGIRLLYNGLPDITEVDGKTHYNCGTTRPKYQIGGIKEEVNLNGTYKYAASYTTSGTNNTTFTLVDPQSITVNSTNAAEQIANIVENYPYTCRTSGNSCTVSSSSGNFYKILEQKSGVKANAYNAGDVENIGDTVWADPGLSIASVGYMYGDYGIYDELDSQEYNEYDPTQTNIYSTTLTLGTTYYYASNYDYGVTTSGKYTLTSPIQITSETNYSNLVGKYVINNATTASTMYYIIDVYNTNKAYVKTLSSGNQDVSISIAESYNSSNQLQNYTTIELKEWKNNYASYKGKYTCGDSRTNCSEPRYLLKTAETNYTYLTGEITISKTRNGLTLVNPVTVPIGVYYDEFDTEYNEYRYTCGNSDTTCNKNDLRYIIPDYTSINEYYGGLTIATYRNYNFGNSVIYENNRYILQDVTELETQDDIETLSNHHFVCLTKGDTECSEVGYIYSSHRANWHYYVKLNSGVTDIDDMLDIFLRTNTIDSIPKTIVETWYEDNLKNTIYESKIEDTIYCNDRTYSTGTFNPDSDIVPFAYAGWNPNGGNPTKSPGFRNSETDLSCPTITDKFSVSNNSAKIKYPIALPIGAELVLGQYAMIGGNGFWTMTPSSFLDGYPYDSHVDAMVTTYSAGGYSGISYGYETDIASSLRPAISLVKGTTFSTGMGTMTDPFVVDMSN